MDFRRGGSARFGKDSMGSEWNYINEDEKTVTIEVMSIVDISKMQHLTFTEFLVITDVQFRLQQDNSFNPSFLDVRFLPLLTPVTMKLTGGRLINHTHLKLSGGINCIIVTFTLFTTKGLAKLRH